MPIVQLFCKQIAGFFGHGFLPRRFPRPGTLSVPKRTDKHWPHAACTIAARHRECGMSFIFLVIAAAANFAVGFGAFVVIGLVEPIATQYGVSSTTAGVTMTAYAVAYAIGSPLLVALSGRLNRKTVVVSGMALFAFGSFCSAVAPTFPLLLASRVVAALGAGLFTPTTAAVGAALATPEKRGQVLSTLFSGVTIAQVLGVPAGTWLGYSYGPSIAFQIAGALGLFAVLALWIVVPRNIAIAPISLKALSKVLRTPHLMLAVTFTASFLSAIYVVYVYFGPLLTHLYGLDKNAKTVLFLVYGSAAVLGNYVGGLGASRIGPSRTLMILCAMQVLCLYLVPNLALGVGVTAALSFVWAVCGWSFLAPQQMRLIAIDQQQVQALFALNASCIYAAAALGSWIGSQTIRLGGFEWLGIVAAAMGVISIAHLVLSDRLVTAARSRGT